MQRKKPILLVEDDLVDVMTVKRCMRDLKIPNELVVTKNGLDALDVLRGESAVVPLFILSDINMPRMNGIELLRELKQDAQLRIFPVIMLTTSSEERDRLASYELSVAGYMRKPVSYEEFRDVIESIYNYWTLSELPSDSS